MPLRNYGLLTGNLVNHGPQHGGNPHYLLIIQAGVVNYNVAVNLHSTIPQGDAPSAIQYQVLRNLGGSKLARKIKNQNDFVVRGLDLACPSLDFVRDGILNMAKFKRTDTGLSPKGSLFLSALIKEAKKSKGPGAFVAVFGTGYPDQDDRPAASSRNPLRASMGFTGVDNVHMNQGNYHRVGTHMNRYFAENGPNQDGALFFFHADGSVVGFFTKFISQDDVTDKFGNPVHTGVPILDSPEVIKPKVRERLTTRSPRLASLVGVDSNAIVRPSRKMRRAPDGSSNGLANPDGNPNTPVPISGTSGGNLAGGYLFSDSNAIVDPNRPFKPDDDSEFRNSPFVKNFASLGVPEPVPGPRNGIDPQMALESVLRSTAISAIVQSGQIVFHIDGDTGAAEVGKLKNEDSVADLMVRDFAPTVKPEDRPAFYFHVGDVVYYYGEEEYYYDQFYKPYKDYPAPIFAIPGNHDGITYKEDMVSLSGFINAFCDDQARHWAAAGGILRSTMTQPGVYFTLNCPLVSIIGLYTNCSESFGYIDDQQKLFLYKELVRLKADRASGKISAILLAVHHSPLSFSAKKPASMELRNAIDKACEEAGTWPDAVFSGHAHIYQRMTRTVTVNGENWQVPHIISGSGGYDMKPRQEVEKSEMNLLDTSDPHFLLHQFLEHYGYLRVVVNKVSATLRVEFRSPEINVGQPSDVCILNLKTHSIQ